MDFMWMLLALVAASLGSTGLAGLLLLSGTARLNTVSTGLFYVAGGSLLGSALLGMLPNAMEVLDTAFSLKLLLTGILFYFLLEKAILWRSCYNANCERHNRTLAPMILIGDAVHNAIDGVIIASGFIISTEMGVFVTLTVILHEIPQELSDFGVLIRSGLSKKMALFYNILSGSTAIASGVIAYFILEKASALIPYALVFSAAGFLYIALADLIPEMHKKTRPVDSFLQIALIMTGLLTIVLLKEIKIH